MRSSSGSADELSVLLIAHDGVRLVPAPELAGMTAAEAAAAGMSAVVADRRVPNAASPAGPMAAVRHPRPCVRRTDSSASAAGISASSVAGTSRTSSWVIKSTDSTSARPRMTMASLPVNFPEMANWLEANVSVRSPVNGDLATTANFALVVSGVPTNGEKTNAKGASGASGSTSGGARRCSNQVPSPTPPR